MILFPKKANIVLVVRPVKSWKSAVSRFFAGIVVSHPVPDFFLPGPVEEVVQNPRNQRILRITPINKKLSVNSFKKHSFTNCLPIERVFDWTSPGCVPASLVDLAVLNPPLGLQAETAGLNSGVGWFLPGEISWSMRKVNLVQRARTYFKSIEKTMVNVNYL